MAEREHRVKTQASSSKATQKPQLNLQPLPTAAQVIEWLRYDPATGSFTWAKRGRGVRFGHPAGTMHKDGRREICILGRRHKAARLAWLIVWGVWPEGLIDHENGIPSDDRIDNLRDVTNKVNIQNQRRAQVSNKSSKLLGVTRRRAGKWQARLMIDGKNLCVGTFDTPEAAHEAYLAAKRTHHQGCTI
ncbi:HNH endonuclease [Hydrogenophaga sp.]|uniref:HNH endonuclease n=1 Tax=Hydrogenophaga sp. TaxID=1904254 RepID=UPI002731563A|nr:HNH endonuclease [Hydrogenophaga sp.]MDP1686901.1 HNH endonuclease [Hydrogenophaga sp.]